MATGRVRCGRDRAGNTSPLRSVDWNVPAPGTRGVGVHAGGGCRVSYACRCGYTSSRPGGGAGGGGGGGGGGVGGHTDWSGGHVNTSTSQMWPGLQGGWDLVWVQQPPGQSRCAHRLWWAIGWSGRF